jgi:hypothetical protein
LVGCDHLSLPLEPTLRVDDDLVNPKLLFGNMAE